MSRPAIALASFAAFAAFAVFAAGCALVPPGADLSGVVGETRGVISRDGVATEFFGYDTTRASTGFGASPNAAGFVEIDGAAVLAVISLELVAPQRFLAEMPDAVPVRARFLNDELGIGLSYIELIDGGDVDSDLFRHSHGEGGAAVVGGSFRFDDTDWATFIRGTLTASIDDPEMGRRDFDLRVEWIGPKE